MPNSIFILVLDGKQANMGDTILSFAFNYDEAVELREYQYSHYNDIEIVKIYQAEDFRDYV